MAITVLVTGLGQGVPVCGFHTHPCMHMLKHISLAMRDGNYGLGHWSRSGGSGLWGSYPSMYAYLHFLYK